MNWRGKAAIVTGGNSGIGEAIARELGQLGLAIAVAGRRQAENERVAIALRKNFGVEAEGISADVSREEDCLELVEAAAARFGRLDVLVNNAGIGGDGRRIADSTTEAFERVLRTNLYSAYWISRQAWRWLARNEPDGSDEVRGAIVNISSLCGVEAWAKAGLYCISKHGMMALSKTMADEGAPERIRVAAVCPAMVATPMANVSGADYIAAEDIAKTVSYLLGLRAAAWPTEIVVRRRGAD